MPPSRKVDIMGKVAYKTPQDHITEEFLLDVKTKTCHFIHTSRIHEQDGITWDALLDDVMKEQLIYYIDIPRVLQQSQWDYMLKKLKENSSYHFQFRINQKPLEWFTVMIQTDEKRNDEILRIRIVVSIQNIFNIKDLIANEDLAKEILLKGFGNAYYNVMWIDVKNDRYRMINTFGNLLSVEMKVQPVGSYIIDNEGYAINGVYKEDWDVFFEHTSLEWLNDHLKKEGDRFSFLMRHLYNGEYRWTEATTVCTKRDENNFHALYWVEDVQDKVFDNTTMKDTLASVEVGQWRLEIKKGEAIHFTASPSLLRVLGMADMENQDAIWQSIKKRIHREDCEKVRNTIFKLEKDKETSFSFRMQMPQGIRYFRCGLTCVAKNDIYTCYQGYGQDITDIMRPMVSTIKKVKKLTFIDQLTGLHNRNYMQSRFVNGMRKDEYPISMIMADCNCLKETNDTLGHEYGDMLLRRVAQSIKECLLPNSIAMRIGGDEFLIMCAHCPNEKAVDLVKNIRQKLNEYSNKMLKLSVSFGIYTMDDGKTTFQEAYKRADCAMYEEKKKYHEQWGKR